MPKLAPLPEPKVFLRPARHQVLGLYESCQGVSDPSHRGCGGSPPFLAGAGGYLLLPDGRGHPFLGDVHKAQKGRDKTWACAGIAIKEGYIEETWAEEDANCDEKKQFAMMR